MFVGMIHLPDSPTRRDLANVSDSYVRSTASPIIATLAPRVHALRIRAFKHGRFNDGIGADQQDRLGIIDILDRRRANIAGPIARRQLGTIRAAFHNTALPFDQRFKRKAASTGARSPTDPATFCLSSPQQQRQAPRAIRFAQLAVFTDIGRIQTLAAQTIPDKPVLSEIHSSFTPSWLRGKMRITSRPLVSTRMFDPSASITSMDSVLVNSQGRAVKA